VEHEVIAMKPPIKRRRFIVLAGNKILKCEK
jgi:hypothetical protein